MRRQRTAAGRPSPALSRARLAELRGLRRDRRRRETAGAYLAEGFHVVEAALEAGAPVRELFLGEGAARSHAGVRIAAAASDAGIPVREVTRRVLDQLADAETPQGVVALLDLPAPGGGLPPDVEGPLVVLDGIQDPGNAGAVLRTADAFGCGAVVFCRGTVDAENPKVLRAAQGSHFHLAVRRGPAASQVVRAARESGRTALAAVPAGGEPLYGCSVAAERALVVFGNEARGVSDGALAACERRVSVPMPGRAESLGVAAAAAVILSWLRREDRE